MNKFLFVTLSLLIAGTQAGNLRKLNGDLHPKHRHLSQEGQLSLSIDGRGYFQYRLRVADSSAAAANDPSQKAPDAGKYDAGYNDGTNANKPAANSDGTVGAGQDDKGDGTNSAETAANTGNGDGDSDFFSQVVYSRDGSMHVNRFGYLVDDNGLLLVSQAEQNSDNAAKASRSTDANAKFHIHVPSRAEGILVTPTGKILAEELGGSAFTSVGQLKLARFENPQGLNIRMRMKSNCAAANEDGFALGNWCAGGDLDGKDHVYVAETAVSGPGIVGNPGDQGFGRIVV